MVPSKMLPIRLLNKEAADTAESAAARFARASRPTKVVLQKSLPRPLMPLLSDLLPMPRLRITRGLPSLQIAEETDGDMDQVQGVPTRRLAANVAQRALFLFLPNFDSSVI